MRTIGPLVLAFQGLLSIAHADPCGMVPPVSANPNVALHRTGPQRTYVFFKDGVETLVVHPGFSGNAAEFGMLVPFPSPPSIRKVPDEIFAQIAAAIDPPEVVIQLPPRSLAGFQESFLEEPAMAVPAEPRLAFDTVRVVNQEAVGMYEVAVVEAGSAAALERWMTQHRFRYPAGMDAVCNEYVAKGWYFVAVKTRIGDKGATNPRPGMREAPDASLPAGATYDGHVQAMGYRFRVAKPVVGMRLSTFNEADERRQIVYVLTDQPVSFDGIPDSAVVRQVPGAELERNVTGPLPVRLFGGGAADLPKERLDGIAADRNPAPHNGQARELFASDLLSAKAGRLSHGAEEREKALLRIGERLSLRGPEVDRLHEAALADEGAVHRDVSGLRGMTLTILDGDFPVELLRARDLTFRAFRLPSSRNQPSLYDARMTGPRPDPGGILLADPDAAIGSPKTRAWFEEHWRP